MHKRKHPQKDHKHKKSHKHSHENLHTMNAKSPLLVVAISAVLVVGLAVVVLSYADKLGLSNPFSAISGPHATVEAVTIVLPPSPADASPDTKIEIKTLLDDKHARSIEVLAAIQKEVSFDGVQIGPYTVGEYREGKMLPNLGKALSYSLPEVERVLAVKQNEFKRTRPSVLEPNIQPVGVVPNHSSYPADYASKARFVAYVLSYIDKTNEANYLSYAEEVAKRQEIAGIQYPLDNAVGAIFAEKFFTEVMKDPEFVALLDAAKLEWEQAGVSTNEIPFGQ